MSCAASTVRSVTDFGCFTQASITLKSFVLHQKRALRSVKLALLHITCNCNSSDCRKVRGYQAAILEKSERSLPDYSSSSPLPLAPDAPRNLLFFGKPRGTMRPASARVPCHSFSSLIGEVKVRPAPSVQVSPSAALKIAMSESPFSL